jgi:hypothetical protein
MRKNYLLPRETVEFVLNPDESLCHICRSGLKVIGKKLFTTKPLNAIKHQQKKVAIKSNTPYITLWDKKSFRYSSS